MNALTSFKPLLGRLDITFQRSVVTVISFVFSMAKTLMRSRIWLLSNTRDVVRPIQHLKQRNRFGISITGRGTRWPISLTVPASMVIVGKILISKLTLQQTLCDELKVVMLTIIMNKDLSNWTSARIILYAIFQFRTASNINQSFQTYYSLWRYESGVQV